MAAQHPSHDANRRCRDDCLAVFPAVEREVGQRTGLAGDERRRAAQREMHLALRRRFRACAGEPAGPAGALLQPILDRYDFTPDERDPAADGKVHPGVLADLFERTVPRRQESGSFYTPPPVVTFMCREVLKGHLSGRTSIPASAVTRLVENHDAASLDENHVAAARHALDRLRTLDPACGCGAYLLGLLYELLGIHEALSPDIDRVSLMRQIITMNLHGVDVDPLAIEIAQSRLGLAASAELPSRLAVGDALLGDLPLSGPDGFDVIVMNPPYLAANRVSGGQRDDHRAYLRRLKDRYGFKSDLYVHFLYRALELLTPGGMMAAITPATYLTNTTRQPLRRRLLDTDLYWLIPMSPDVFDATVFCCICILRRRPADESSKITFVNLRQGTMQGLTSAAALRAGGHAASPEAYRRAWANIFFEPTPARLRLFTQLLLLDDVADIGGRRFVPLGLIAPALDCGIDSGNVRHRLFHRDPPAGRTLPRLVQGRQVVRYGCRWDHPAARFRYVDVDYVADPSRPGVGRGGQPSGRGEYWRFRGSRQWHHAPQRLLMRQTADEPYVGYLRQSGEVTYTDNTVHTLVLTERGQALGLSYGYLLAVLNSASLRAIYRSLAQEENRRLAQVKTALVNRLPIAIPGDDERLALERCVTAIQQGGDVCSQQTEIDTRVAAMYVAH